MEKGEKFFWLGWILMFLSIPFSPRTIIVMLGIEAPSFWAHMGGPQSIPEPFNSWVYLAFLILGIVFLYTAIFSQ